jgi:hypothetical protein
MSSKFYTIKSKGQTLFIFIFELKFIKDPNFL